jgi:hypothetical protein
MTTKLTIAAIAFAVLITTAARADTLYSNNFDSGSVAGLSGAGASSADIVNTGNATYGSYLYLASQGGPNSGGTASLSLNTTGFSSLTLSFSVYAINTLDGDGPAGGNSPVTPDSFITALTGGFTLENYSFANFPGDTQDYPGGQGPATPGEPDQTGAVAVNQFSDGDDAIYVFSYTFTPTGDLTTINFTGQTNQGLGDESFGLDNVVVTGVESGGGTPVPESGSAAMLGAGLLGLGLMRRRRG